MPENLPTSAGRTSAIALRDLRLDPVNPRIPENYQTAETADLAALMEMGFEAFPVAESIAELGYFSAEPLIVIPSATEENAWVVVEGNRRLTALLGLTYKSVRDGFAKPDRWHKLAEKRSLSSEMSVPVVIHESRETTHAEVARVHVTGKLPWRPFMQARYIAARIAEGRTFQEVAELIGITKSKAADLYRDQAVLLQAQREGLETSQIESAFSLLTVAMGSTKVRAHVGAPLGSQTIIGQDPIASDKIENLKEVIQWIFGDEDHEAVISDHRKIPLLGNVMANEAGLSALRAGKTLEEAKQSVEAAGLDPITAISRKLWAAKNSLSSASDDVAEFANNSLVNDLVDDISSILESMRSTIEEVRAATSEDDDGS